MPIKSMLYSRGGLKGEQGVPLCNFLFDKNIICLQVSLKTLACQPTTPLLNPGSEHR